MPIVEGYSRLRKRFGKITAYLQLVRPFTLLAPIFAGLLGVLSTVPLTFETLMTAIYVGVTLALCQATGQIMNQYADVELDKIVKPYRPLPKGMVTREEALGCAWLLAIISVARAFTISQSFGLAIVALLFFAVFYSLSPFSPRKIHPILNLLWMAFSRGFIPILAVWSIYGDITKALPYALLAFTWVFGFQGTKDLEDIEGDRQFGIKTVATDYGSTKLRLLMIFATVAYLGITFGFGLVLMSFLTIPSLIAILKFDRKSPVTENNYGWLMFYVGLAALFLLMFFSEFFSTL